MGHIQFYCKKLQADLEEFKKSKDKGKEKDDDEDIAATLAEDDLLMVEDGANGANDGWFFDSACSNHICSKKEWFNTYDSCKGEAVRLADNTHLDVAGKGTVKIKMHNGCVKTFGNVKYVPTARRNLISLGKLDSLGYGYSAKGGDMRITRGSLVIMKGTKTKGNLYQLKGKIVIGKGGAYTAVKKVERVYVPKKGVSFVDGLIKPSGACY
jgi:hypothetical protein